MRVSCYRSLHFYLLFQVTFHNNRVVWFTFDVFVMIALTRVMVGSVAGDGGVHRLFVQDLLFHRSGIKLFLQLFTGNGGGMS